MLPLFSSQVSSQFDSLKADNWIEIDADQAVDEIHKQVTIVVALEQVFIACLC